MLVFALDIMKITINEFERKMILDALLHKAYIEKVSLPQTKHFIRQIYKSLVERIANVEAKIQTEGKPEKAIKALKSRISFLNFKMGTMEKEEKKRAEEEILECDQAAAYLEDL